MTRKNMGTVLAIVMVVGLMMCLTSCGVEVRTESKKPEASEARTEISEVDVEEPEIAKYPGELARQLFTSFLTNDGYEIGVRMDLYEPMPMLEDYVNPFAANHVIEKVEGYDGEVAYAIPFMIAFANQTEGFGTAEDVSIMTGILGQMSDHTPRGELCLEVSTTMGDQLQSRRDAQDAYLYPVFQAEGWSQIPPKPCFNVLVADLPEGGENKINTGSMVGYYVFVDRKSTPKQPGGLTIDEMANQDMMIMVGINKYSPTNAYYYQCMGVANLTKDEDGALVFEGKTFARWSVTYDGEYVLDEAY